MIPSSFLSGWNLNALFQCKSENVAIWLRKQITCFGFLSRCREGTELNLLGKEGEMFPVQTVQLWALCVLYIPAIRSCSLSAGNCTTFSLQTCGVESTFIIVGFKLQLLFHKPLGKEYFGITSCKILVFQGTEQGIWNSQIRKPRRPTRSFIAAILELISVQELCVLFLAAKELFMASMFSSQSEWGVQPGQTHQSNANHWQGIMNTSWAEFKYNPWMRGKICMRERIIRIWFNKQYIKWAFAA